MAIYRTSERVKESSATTYTKRRFITRGTNKGGASVAINHGKQEAINASKEREREKRLLRSPRTFDLAKERGTMANGCIADATMRVCVYIYIAHLWANASERMIARIKRGPDDAKKREEIYIRLRLLRRCKVEHNLSR